MLGVPKRNFIEEMCFKKNLKIINYDLACTLVGEIPKQNCLGAG